MIKQNLHTHSIYCDGKDSIDEMVQTAIDKGFTILGFSGHGPCRYDSVAMKEEDLTKYIEDILDAKEKYKDKIQIFLGIEEDISQRIPSKKPYDFVIGSEHFLIEKGEVLNVDYSDEHTKKIVETFDHDFHQYAKAYYEGLQKIAEYDEVDIVGHLDLLMKFNEDQKYGSFTDPVYLSYAKECIDVLIAAGKIFEINTGAIARGYRKDPYPHQTLLSYIQKKKGNILLSSDCHDRNNLDCHFKESMELIQACGFDSMMVLTSEGFKKTPIEQFAR
ncbi:histidinol-phosphatase [uncultured Faecalicoccus sp.]|uniref:histidinol-phosphatase n=1 Tax=uncultured Faecalicoccus sp. TaxID=1971760 RepID=UPI00261AF512|nr:histidinol-phosphatase [uncultured Faecalicoccus sp.]